jgi:fructose-1-phosphate kinase PfkB-like protein
VQFIGTGDEGDALAEALRARSPKGTDETLWFRTASRGRICTTLVDPSGSATEIVEKSGEVSSAECEQLLGNIKRLRKTEGEVPER